jgi:hypothetical protein
MKFKFFIVICLYFYGGDFSLMTNGFSQDSTNGAASTSEVETYNEDLNQMTDESIPQTLPIIPPDGSEAESEPDIDYDTDY